MEHEATLTGVCIVRIRARGSGGVLITLRSIPDIEVRGADSVRNVTNVDEAMKALEAFLRHFLTSGG